VLERTKGNEGVEAELQGKHMSGVGELLHVARWLRPETLNVVRELSKKSMTVATTTHLKAIHHRVMTCCVATKKRGLLLLKPDIRAWNRLPPGHKFVMAGKADSAHVSCSDTMRSTGGQTVLLEGAPVVMRSKMQKVVVLSSTETDLMSGTECAQEMPHTMIIVESLGLKVKKPVLLEMDNK
jgi:hypothetical protein